jgi:hypothetical protein
MAMAGHHRIKIDAAELRAIAALCKSYGALFEEASRTIANPVQIDGIQTIHTGLKAMRRAAEKLVGIPKLPDDAAFDDFIHRVIVESGLNTDYNAKAGRRWSIKEKREMIADAERRISSKRKRKPESPGPGD